MNHTTRLIYLILSAVVAVGASSGLYALSRNQRLVDEIQRTEQETKTANEEADRLAEEANRLEQEQRSKEAEAAREKELKLRAEAEANEERRRQLLEELERIRQDEFLRTLVGRTSTRARIATSPTVAGGPTAGPGIFVPATSPTVAGGPTAGPGIFVPATSPTVAGGPTAGPGIFVPATSPTVADGPTAGPGIFVPESVFLEIVGYWILVTVAGVIAALGIRNFDNNTNRLLVVVFIVVLFLVAAYNTQKQLGAPMEWSDLQIYLPAIAVPLVYVSFLERGSFIVMLFGVFTGLWYAMTRARVARVLEINAFAPVVYTGLIQKASDGWDAASQQLKAVLDSSWGKSIQDTLQTAYDLSASFAQTAIQQGARLDRETLIQEESLAGEMNGIGKQLGDQLSRLSDPAAREAVIAAAKQKLDAAIAQALALKQKIEQALTNVPELWNQSKRVVYYVGGLLAVGLMVYHRNNRFGVLLQIVALGLAYWYLVQLVPTPSREQDAKMPYLNPGVLIGIVFMVVAFGLALFRDDYGPSPQSAPEVAAAIPSFLYDRPIGPEFQFSYAPPTPQAPPAAPAIEAIEEEEEQQSSAIGVGVFVFAVLFAIVAMWSPGKQKFLDSFASSALPFQSPAPLTVEQLNGQEFFLESYTQGGKQVLLVEFSWWIFERADNSNTFRLRSPAFTQYLAVTDREMSLKDKEKATLFPVEIKDDGWSTTIRLRPLGSTGGYISERVPYVFILLNRAWMEWRQAKLSSVEYIRLALMSPTDGEILLQAGNDSKFSVLQLLGYGMQLVAKTSTRAFHFVRRSNTLQIEETNLGDSVGLFSQEMTWYPLPQNESNQVLLASFGKLELQYLTMTTKEEKTVFELQALLPEKDRWRQLFTLKAPDDAKKE